MSTLMEHEEDEKRVKERGLGGLAQVIAAYIDLNPLRAGEVTEPEGNVGSGFRAVGDFVGDFDAMGENTPH